MQKIPTLFERDWSGDRSRVINQVHAGCEWVVAGEGVATRKLDGMCCMIRDGKLYKRREVREFDAVPPEFEKTGHDPETGKTVGWVPVGDGPEDRYHWEGFAFLLRTDDGAKDGTYELVGPKVQGNPEGLTEHQLVPRSALVDTLTDPPPRTYDGLREWLAGRNIEGIVFHHPDGRMAKIKQRDFGQKRSK